MFTVQVYKSSESLFVKAASHYPHKDAFFEMVRFDFVLDEDLKVKCLAFALYWLKRGSSGDKV
jgi:hypothetical protein